MYNVDEISLIIFSITSVWLLFGSIGLKTTFFIGQLMQVWYWKALLLLYMYAYWFIITDIDECSDGSNTCLSYATCTDTIGSYTCKCPEKGFKGDGHECTGLRINSVSESLHLLCFFLWTDSFYSTLQFSIYQF